MRYGSPLTETTGPPGTVLLSCIALRGLKKGSCMTANNVTPFEVFKSLIEFYPRLGATIALGSFAAAARMIPTGSAVISDVPPEKGPEIVSPTNNSGRKKRASPRKRIVARKKQSKSLKRATVRRKTA